MNVTKMQQKFAKKIAGCMKLKDKLSCVEFRQRLETDDIIIRQHNFRRFDRDLKGRKRLPKTYGL